MSFDWSWYLHLASKLEVDARSETNPLLQEAMWRSSISRAYYAVWLKARNYLRTRSEAEVTAHCPQSHRYADQCLRGHGCVVAYYTHHADNVIKDAGTMLDTMMQNRKRADYNDVITRPLRTCTDQLKLADVVTQALDTL